VIQVLLANEQTALAVDRRPLCRAVRRILRDEAIAEARVSLAIVDDPTIRRLHRRFLARDHPTDVLSFTLERSAGSLDGEVVVSAQTACRVAVRFGWSPAHELLLYVIHGTLHLVGMEDSSPGGRARMRASERHYLAQFGLEPPVALGPPTRHRSRPAPRRRCSRGRSRGR
jgi:probable rRNA maturation factor